MRLRHVLLLFGSIVLVLFGWYLARRGQAPAATELLDEQQRSSAASAGVSANRPVADPMPPLEQGYSNAANEYVRNIIEDPEYAWKQRISFYGRVVDEKDQPLSGVNVRFVWTDLSQRGTSEFQTLSDPAGFFSLENRQGKGLSVRVSKEGYYTPQAARKHFDYSSPAEGPFKSDPNNPVVFRLRKMGTSVDLVTSQFGVRTDFPIHIPRDGTPIWVDFLQRKTGATGQMQIIQSKPDYESWKEADYWSFQIEIPDGGFVEHTEEFPFEAPEIGYQRVISFEFRKGEPGWTEDILKDYYIRFGDPPLHGRLHLRTAISMGGALLTYAINPGGSRSLEAKQPPP